MKIDTLRDQRAAIDALALEGAGNSADSAKLLGEYARIKAAADISLRAATVRLGAGLSVAEIARILGRLDADVKPRMDSWYAARPGIPIGLLVDTATEEFLPMSIVAESLGVSRHAVAAMGHSGELPCVITPTGRILFDISGVKR